MNKKKLVIALDKAIADTKEILDIILDEAIDDTKETLDTCIGIMTKGDYKKYDTYQHNLYILQVLKALATGAELGKNELDTLETLGVEIE